MDKHVEDRGLDPAKSYAAIIKYSSNLVFIVK